MYGIDWQAQLAMTMVWLLAMMMVEQAAQKPVPVKCSPIGVKQPPLILADSKGKCGKGYAAQRDKDGKVMYCVSTVFPTPVKCESVALPPATGGKKK